MLPREQQAPWGRRDNVPKSLPIYIAVGEHDPAHGQLTLVNALVDRLQSVGIHDVTLKIYPEARHEVFNQTNRDEVYADLIAWMIGTRLALTARTQTTRSAAEVLTHFQANQP